MLQQRPGHQPVLPRSDILSARLIQDFCFQTITHFSARRTAPIPFSFNHFRTLCTATEGVPSLHSDFAPFWCNLNLFRINTYGPPRKCCKQKTYAKANPFRCNAYTKSGGGAHLPVPIPEVIPLSSSFLSFLALTGTPFCKPFSFMMINRRAWGGTSHGIPEQLL